MEEELRGQKVWVAGLEGELGDRHASWRSAPFLVGTPAAMLRDQPLDPDQRQWWKELTAAG